MYGDGDTKGRSVINRTRISGNQAICCLVPDKNMMYEEYLLYYIKNIKNDLRELARGAGQDNLNQSLIINRRIPVPPLDEQERIVEAVKERLERMGRLQKSVENVGRHAKEYRDSLIEYLFTGREDLSTPSPNQIPTEDDVPKGWDIQTIGEISSQIRTGGTPKKSRDDFWGGDIPWKASKHFNENSLQLSDSSEHVTDKGKSESTMANPDDVVIVCRGAHTGKVGLAQSNFLFNQDVKVIRLPESVHSEFVAHYLSNHTEYFLQKQRGGTTKGITTRHVKNLRIPIPPVEQQRDIVAELKSIDFSRVSKAVSDVSTHFDEYRSSVLAHAFNGQIDY
jgi:type I restriction enzyme S subunit